jgi:phage protein D
MQEGALPPSDLMTSHRAPLARIITNGGVIPGLIEVEVSSNGHFSSDRFSASFALSGSGPYGIDFWSSELNIPIEILFSLDSTSFVGFFTGTVDTISINVPRGIVNIMGRDLSAELIESRIEEAFPNHTSSDIAFLLANRHGLTPNVAPTATPVGRYYQDEHDRITLGQFSRSTTEWDLLVFLALQEGFDVSVTGATLNFRPADDAAAVPYILTPSNCVDLKLTRCLTLARDIAVTVKSWSSRQKTAFSQTLTGANNTDSGSDGTSNPRQYVFVHPNLTANQALNLARRKLADLTMHERVVEFVVPGELSLTPIGKLIVSGTDTEFDQAYYIDVVERRLSLSDGFTQRVRAKSSSPRSTVIN